MFTFLYSRNLCPFFDTKTLFAIGISFLLSFLYYLKPSSLSLSHSKTSFSSICIRPTLPSFLQTFQTFTFFFQNNLLSCFHSKFFILFCTSKNNEQTSFPFILSFLPLKKRVSFLHSKFCTFLTFLMSQIFRIFLYGKDYFLTSFGFILHFLLSFRKLPCSPFSHFLTLWTSFSLTASFLFFKKHPFFSYFPLKKTPLP